MAVRDGGVIELVRRIRTRLADQSGASAVEYGLLVVAIAAVIAVVVFALGIVTRGNVAVACGNWNAAAGTTTGC